MKKEAIIEAAAKLETTYDLLCLLNKIKMAELGEKGYPFIMSHLNYFIHPARNKISYKTFYIPKKSGGVREILAPRALLKSFLTYTNKLLQAFYDAPQYVTGFVPEKSVVDNAEFHIGKNFVFNTDLKDFFPSITKSRISATLKHPPFNFNDTIADAIAGLCCTETVIDGKKHWVLPQGSPCSPVLTNIVCQNLDRQLQKLAKKYRLRYSRYADDITFSGNRNVFRKDGSFQRELKTIIVGQNFTINEKKTRLQPKDMRQEVTGLVVSDRVNVSREYVRNIDNLLYIWEKYGEADAYAKFLMHYTPKQNLHKDKPNMRAVLQGKLLYLKMVKGADNEVWKRLQQRFNKLTGNNAANETEAAKFKYVIADFEKKIGTPLRFEFDDRGILQCSFSLNEARAAVALSRYARTRITNILTKNNLDQLEKFKNGYMLIFYEGKDHSFWRIERKRARVKIDPILNTNVNSIMEKDSSGQQSDEENDETEVLTYVDSKDWNVGRKNNPYNIKEAKKNRKAESSISHTWKDELLKQAKAQEFIDSGKLADWVRIKEAKKEPKTVHFVIVRKNGESPMFAAIETKRSETTIQAVNEKGEAVNLQLLGRVTSNEFKEDSYKKFHEHAIEQTSHFRNSEGNTPNITVVNETTTITRMFSGRMDVGQKKEKRSEPYTLAQLVENEDPNSWALMLKIGNDVFVQDNGESIDSKKIASTNAYTESSGWAYIITKEPDGLFHPKALQLAEFNLEWWSKNADSPVGKVLTSLINELFKNWSNKPAENKDIIETFLTNLHYLLYFGQNTDKKLAIVGNVISLNYDQLGILGADKIQNTQVLLKALLGAGLRFNISKATFAMFSNMDLINSNIFTTNLKSLHNFGASFKIARMVEKNGEFSTENNVNAKVDTSTPLSSTRPSGEIVNRARTKLNITIDGGKTTVFYDSADQKYYSEEGVEIADDNTLELARTLQQAKQGQLPEEYYYKDKRSPVFKVTFKDGSVRFIRRDGTVISLENQYNVRTAEEIEAAKKNRKNRKTGHLSSDNLFEAAEGERSAHSANILGIHPGEGIQNPDIIETVSTMKGEVFMTLQEKLANLGYGQDLFSQLENLRNKYPNEFGTILNGIKTNNIETATEIIDQVLGCK